MYCGHETNEEVEVSDVEVAQEPEERGGDEKEVCDINRLSKNSEYGPFV